MENVYENDTVRWLLGKITKTTTTAEVDARPTRKKVVSFTYDPETGRMIQENIHHPETDVVLHRTEYGVDENGNEAVDSYGNNLAITTSGQNFQSQTKYASYSSDGRFVESETNALGFTATTTVYSDTDTTNGAYPLLPNTVTDINGINTRFYYDSFGRQTKKVAAWGTAAQMEAESQFRPCNTSCPTDAVYYVQSQSSGAGMAIAYHDVLGRVIKQKSQVIKEHGNAATWVHIDFTYDHRGRLIEQSKPYFEGSSTIYTSVQSYDDLDRLVTLTHPDGRVDSTVYNGKWVTTYTDIHGKNQSNRVEKNILGETVSVTDNQANKISYTYDAHGNLLTTTSEADNVVVTLTYDEMGRKKSMSDPDKGDWSYTYNGLGQLITQTNARGETTCNAYDVIGRLIKRIDNYQGETSSVVGAVSESTQQCGGDVANTETAEWYYDSAPGASLGQLHQLLGKDGFEETYHYDSFGRITKNIKTVNGESFETDTTYDNLSRPEVVTYPGPRNRLQIRNVYNSLGGLSEIRDAANDTLYYQVEELDARGNIVEEVFGNGVKTTRNYLPENGRLQTIYTGSGIPGNDIQQLEFGFDSLGNLDSRDDHLNNFQEDFIYDSYNRLTTNTAYFGNSNSQITNVTYYKNGNIRTKTGIGEYRYGNDCVNGYGPHAVCEIEGDTNAIYTYDANGNMLSGDGREIRYTLFDKPMWIQNGSQRLTEIAYGPDRTRYYRRDTIASKVIEHTYIGGAYERVLHKDDGVSTSKTEERHFLGGFAVLTIENRSELSSGTSNIHYLHKDHIGSVTAITNDAATLVEEFSFDPWGKRRAVSLSELELYHGDWSQMSSNQQRNLATDAFELSSTITNRGYTGHEQMDAVGLIHMNGRVYDANIGRFIQADPIIQAPLDFQSYNRFSYVRNNPLSLTDPSGYSWLGDQAESVRGSVKRFYKSHIRNSAFVRLHESAAKEVIRGGIKIREWESEINPFIKPFDEYVGSHKWARDVISAAVAFYSGGDPAAMALTQAYFAYTQGANTGEILNAGASSYIASQIGFTGSPVDTYVVNGISSGGKFGSFRDHLESWAENYAINWALNQTFKGLESVKDSWNASGEVVVPENIKNAIERTFEEKFGEILVVDDVTVIANSKWASFLDAITRIFTFGKYGIRATTQKNTIYLNGELLSPESFLNDAGLLLHEYFHVIKQWNNSRMNNPTYLLTPNRWEVEAIEFSIENENTYRFHLEEW